MEAPRIVVELISPSHRRFHVNATFGCELEHGIFQQQLEDMMSTTNPESLQEARELMTKFLSEHSATCSLMAALDTLEFCGHDHDGKSGTVDVTINLARADWSVVQKQVIALLKRNLAWGDNLIELDVVQ